MKAKDAEKEGSAFPDRRSLGEEREPMGQLAPQEWMVWPETKTLLDALQARGAEVRYVGGCVRDGLLNRPVRDVDLATPDLPDAVLALLTAAGIAAVPTGLKHGTVTARIGSRAFEITTLREDVETDGRRATVRWSSSWMLDAARRDFTINALSARPDGAVYDYFNGIEHLAQGRVIFVGRAMDRVAEDRLRILRYFRFQACYGRPPPDGDALEACRAQAKHLGSLSGERVCEELMKTLAVSTCPDIMATMRGVRVLEAVLPEALDFGRLRQVVFLEDRGLRMLGLEVDPLRRLGAMLTGGGEAGRTAALRLRLSNRRRDRLIAMLENGENLPLSLPLPECRLLVRRWGKERFRDALILAWGHARMIEERLDSRLSRRLIERLELLEAWIPPVFPLKGGDLLTLGLASGPEVGRMAAALEAWWEERECRPDREELLAEAERRLRAIR